jgi:aldose 1-epimerase
MIIETKTHGALTFTKVTNGAGFSVTLCDFGAAIYEMSLRGKPLCIAEADCEKWSRSDAYFGKTVGRVAGRIPHGILDYLGKRYQLDVNEKGINTLHGGKEGFSFLPFRMDMARLGKMVSIDYYLVSPANAMGFPGEVDLRVRYQIGENGARLRIIYEMKSSEQTPLNITCHAYFNLGGEPTIENQILQVHSSKTEHYDADLAPLGFVRSPSCLDFSLPKALGKDIADPYLQDSPTKGYDHCFLLDEGKRAEPVLIMEGGGLRMKLFTDYPAVQIYSDNFPREGALLTNGQTERLHAGLAIEPVYKPNDFRSMTVIPYETKKHMIEYAFEDAEGPQ